MTRASGIGTGIHRCAVAGAALCVTTVFLLCCLLGLVPQADAASSFEPRTRQPMATARTLARLMESPDDGLQRKVWVCFTDKNIFDEETYRARCADVAAVLDEHAAARRLKTLAPMLVDFHDIPVHRGYVQQVEGLGATVARESRWLNAVSVRAPLPVLRAIAALPCVQKLTLVGRGWPVRPLPSVSVDPHDSLPGVRDLFDYGSSRDQLDEIGVLEMHDLGMNGAGVRITMIDTGYWREHPAFDRILSEGRLLAQWDFINDDDETQDEAGDPEGQHFHGTTTWSVAGGFAEGELIGPAYGADFLLAKTEDTSGEDPIEEDNWVAAMEWSDALGTDIISSSLSYIDWYEYSDMDGDTATTTIAADIAASRGIVVCTGAGNQGTQDWYYIGAPADGDSVIAVGATEPDGTMWSDSSHGPTYDGRTKPEVCARGAVVYGGKPPGGHGGDTYYQYFDGTSMSCPLVAGCAALLLEAHPEWPAMTVREALMMTADNAENPDNHRGWGRINVFAALTYGISGADDLSAGTGMHLMAAPSPFAGTTRISYDLPAAVGGAATAPAVLEILSPEGSWVRTYHLGSGSHAIEWDGRDARGRRVVSGVYLMRLLAGEREMTRKVILTRR